ncbi:type IV pilin protein [Paucibacter sp. Y2R2-4]|uniref:type IV pilin protein n=1 Tax=Paucibacter sp. Y2R2-4 TaxID=2893553 RepID=UPI0029623425|nr:type IV pilin protein [Paucibacter sp. Y2R2-4]
MRPDHITRSKQRSHRAHGFTMVELMITLAVAGILAAVALPSYSSYVNKSRAKGASADLAALALNMENNFQLQLKYPVNAAGTVASNTNFKAWSPAQSAYFNYTLVSTASSYTLTATGKDKLSGCNLTLDNLNTRTASSSCGFTTW